MAIAPSFYQVTPEDYLSMPDDALMGAAKAPAGISFGIPQIMGALGAYNLLAVDDVSPARGALQGAASGAAIGSMFPGPGTIIGAGIGGLIGLGKGLLSRKSTQEIQAERMQRLLQRSITGYKDFLASTMKDAGQAAEIKNKYEADPEIFKGFDPESGIWINEEFDKSRKESSLTPYDIWGGTGLFETYGSDYLGKWNEKQRYDVNQALLNEGLIREQKGGIYVTNPSRAREIADQVLSGKYDFKGSNEGYVPPNKRRQPDASNTSPAIGSGASLDPHRIPSETNVQLPDLDAMLEEANDISRRAKIRNWAMQFASNPYSQYQFA